mgnify:CR=1 FL=1
MEESFEAMKARYIKEMERMRPPAPLSPPEEKPERDTGLNPEMLKMVSALMQAMRLSGKDSPETSFLKSLKPLLRPEKSAKIDQALQMIQLMGIMNALGKNGIPGLSAPTDP